MNTPGVKISPRLAKIALGFIALVILGVFIWPHLWPSRASVPEIPLSRFQPPPSLISLPTPSLARFMPLAPAQATPAPKARPTPCQPCIEAAREVLTRYLHAIRTGAGADNREEQRNVYETPQLVPNPPAPVWRPGIAGNEQSHF